jgi:hypothetical protein
MIGDMNGDEQSFGLGWSVDGEEWKTGHRIFPALPSIVTGGEYSIKRHLPPSHDKLR